MTPTAMVIDRPTAARIGMDAKQLGGAWTEMFETWLRLSPMAYLVMMAHTKERIRLRAPLTAMAVDDDALRLVLRQFCQELDNTRCRWALFVEAGSTAEQITRQELLLDVKDGGHCVSDHVLSIYGTVEVFARRLRYADRARQARPAVTWNL